MKRNGTPTDDQGRPIKNLSTDVTVKEPDENEYRADPAEEAKLLRNSARASARHKTEGASPSAAESAPANAAPTPAPAQTDGVKVHVLDDGTVPMIDQNGDLWKFPKESAYEAIRSNGMQPLSREDFGALSHAQEIRKRYGTGAANQAGAAAEGLADSLTFGGATALAHRFSTDPEKYEVHRQLGGYEAGNAAGLLASMATGGGEAKAALEAAEDGGAALKAATKAAPEVKSVADEITKIPTGDLGPLDKTAVPHGAPVPESAEAPTKVPVGEPLPVNRKGPELPRVDQDITRIPVGEPIETTAVPRADPLPEKTFGGGTPTVAPRGAPEPIPAQSGSRMFDPADAFRDEGEPPAVTANGEPTPAPRPPPGEPVPGASTLPYNQALDEVAKQSGPRNAAMAANHEAKLRLAAKLEPFGLTPEDLAGEEAAKRLEGFSPLDRNEIKAAQDEYWNARHNVQQRLGHFEGEVPEVGQLSDQLRTPSGRALPRNEFLPKNEPLPDEVHNLEGIPIPEGVEPEPATGIASEAAPEPPPAPTTPSGAPESAVTGRFSAPPPGEPLPSPESSPGAPGPHPLELALQTVTAPNRALFGMGKKVGSLVEEASGSSILGHAAQGAAETVPFTLGQNASDAEVNNEPLTWERLTAGIGVNALVGGTLGAGLGAAAEGLDRLKMRIPELTEHPFAPKDPVELARGVANSFQSAAIGTENTVREVYSTGAKYARIEQLLNGSAKVVTEGTPEFAQFGKWAASVVHTAENLPGNTEAQRAFQRASSDLLEKLQGATTDAQANKAADEFKREVGQWIKREGVQNPATREFQAAMRKVEAETINMLQDENLWGKAGKFQRDLNKLVSEGIELGGKGSGLRSRFQSKGELLDEDAVVFDDAKVYKFINDLHSERPISKMEAEKGRQVLQEWMDNRKNLIGFLKNEVYEPLGQRGKLDALHESLGGNDEKLAEAIRNDKLLSDSQKKTLLQRVIGDHRTRLAVASALMVAGVPHAFLLTYGVSYALDKLISAGMSAGGFERSLAEHGARFSNTITTNLSAAFKSAAGTAPAAVGVLGKMSFAGEPSSATKRHEQAVHLAAQVTALASDPEKLNQSVAQSTAILAKVHPEAAMGVQAQATKAIAFLADKAPKDPLPPNPMAPKTVWTPGRGQVAAFETVAEVVANPLVIIRDFGNGSLTHEQMETANAVYPELTGQIQQEAIRLAASGAAGENGLSYHKRLAFERLTGQTYEWSSKPDAIASLQQTVPQQAKPNPSAGGKANKSKKGPAGGHNIAEQVDLDLQSGLARV